MNHQTIIDGTVHSIIGGKTLVDGTEYSIKEGNTVINGTAYKINFKSGVRAVHVIGKFPNTDSSDSAVFAPDDVVGSVTVTNNSGNLIISLIGTVKDSLGNVTKKLVVDLVSNVTTDPDGQYDERYKMPKGQDVIEFDVDIPDNGSFNMVIDDNGNQGGGLMSLYLNEQLILHQSTSEKTENLIYDIENVTGPVTVELNRYGVYKSSPDPCWYSSVFVTR